MKINILSSEMPHGEFSQRQYHEVFTGLRTNVKRPATYRSCWPLSSYGAEGETRTPTPIRALDPEPSVSTNSTTSAIKARAIYSKREMPLQGKNGGWGLGAGGWGNLAQSASGRSGMTMTERYESTVTSPGRAPFGFLTSLPCATMTSTLPASFPFE